VGTPLSGFWPHPPAVGRCSQCRPVRVWTLQCKRCASLPIMCLLSN